MKIALIQTSLFWEDSAKNRLHFEAKINEINVKIDLFVLPEMFLSGFTMLPNLVAASMDGESVRWLQGLAKVKNCAIAGSMIIKENNNFYNRFLFVFPSGEVQFYDKRHLFGLAGENQLYTSGQEKKIVEFRGWKFCLQICYDLRFPVFSRNVEDYDVLLYVANWPKTRINAWDALLKARAIENMCYTVAVNRTGFDPNNLEYNGHSQVLDFLGNYILDPQEINGVFCLELNKELLLETRKKLGFLDDKDSFELKT